MKIQEFEKYNSSKQIEEWNQIKDRLSPEEKEIIVENALSKDIWGYLDLLSEILFDIASDSDKYIQILETLSSKVKNDMAQGPFLSTLIKIGQEKKDIAIQLRNKIIEKSRSEHLKILSGLILGGIGTEDEKTILDLIEMNIKQEKTSSILQSYLKAILIMNEKQKEIDKRYLSIVENTLNKKDEGANIEIMNFSLSNYNKNKQFFYKIIKTLISENNDSYKRFLFSRLSYQDIIEEKKLFELISLSKDADEKVLDEIVMCLRKHPSQKRKILNLYFYWINKGLYFKIRRNFDWVLEEIMKKDHSILSLFIKLFRKIDDNYSYVVVPHIFESLAKNNVDLAIAEAMKIRPRNKIETSIKLRLLKNVIGLCYTDKTNAGRIQKLAKYLVNEAKKRPYSTIDIKPELINAESLSKDKYDLLVNQVSKIIDNLEVKKKFYNYSIIRKNLKKYPYVKKYGEDIIRKCKNDKKYSPLLWLLENEIPDLTKININKKDDEFNKAIKINFLRDKFWPRAYLTELNNSLSLFEVIKNHKYKTINQKKKYIQDNLMNEEAFWHLFSELIVMNKLGKNNIKSKDIIIRDNDIDFETELFNKLVFLEVTAPEMDRSLRLANGTVGLKNKSFSVIDGKYKQIMKTGVYKNPKYKDKFYFYIIIDISNSTIDEYDLLNSLFGSLTFNLVIDKSTGKTIKEYTARSPDSLGHKNKKTEIVSGVIYFKRDLVIDEKNNSHIRLIGNIINNPNSKKILNDEDIQKLKEIMFKID